MCLHVAPPSKHAMGAGSLHCSIQWNGVTGIQSKITITDLGSRNGTWVSAPC